MKLSCPVCKCPMKFSDQSNPRATSASQLCDCGNYVIITISTKKRKVSLSKRRIMRKALVKAYKDGWRQIFYRQGIDFPEDLTP